MEFFEPIKSYYYWAAGLPIGYAIKKVWEHRDKIQEVVMFFWNFKKRFEVVEKQVLNPISKEAKFCPNCDTRLEIYDTRRFDIWFYLCKKCNQSYKYPAPTSKL